ncbi:DUF402 domain-containing protein [Bacillus wiedmannii]|uniref:DUF402 domain-containing protein n=1 Tax=Bacillus cereus group TaxID=86661 RepID=UPI000BF47423|nr:MULTISPECIES: DUF402 domain-containing protein [Bacillus cereus group]KAA0784191.1 DUF402 domain-containing protein [Bacillus sp. BB081]MED2841020.1 DUF402 domain-containing protein [Bacillus wiedmannii]PEP74768.1 DUF402 domain-containing protein [Bacillus wiedmannii]PGB99146.1 DUF402 domain-containing protein [Bacillus wiedmannii]PGC22202.1 DUF402 domain-containing protein [Bacillus wiedmannii]
MSCLCTSDIEIIERKIRYDGTTVDHACLLIEAQRDKIILYHEVQYSFTMAANDMKLTIPKGSYTIAYYWANRPYNLYIWRDKNGMYLGSYFNVVKNTQITGEVVSFEDLIIDIMVLPNGEYFILDEDELPEPLGNFEDGYVKEALYALTGNIQELLSAIILETNTFFKNGLWKK